MLAKLKTLHRPKSFWLNWWTNPKETKEFYRWGPHRPKMNMMRAQSINNSSMTMKNTRNRNKKTNSKLNSKRTNTKPQAHTIKSKNNFLWGNSPKTKIRSWKESFNSSNLLFRKTQWSILKKSLIPKNIFNI